MTLRGLEPSDINMHKHQRKEKRESFKGLKETFFTDFDLILITLNSTSNKCIASSNKCLTSSNKKLLEVITLNFNLILIKF